jgi:hypothetical protein
MVWMPFDINFHVYVFSVERMLAQGNGRRNMHVLSPKCSLETPVLRLPLARFIYYMSCKSLLGKLTASRACICQTDFIHRQKS